MKQKKNPIVRILKIIIYVVIISFLLNSCSGYEETPLNVSGEYVIEEGSTLSGTLEEIAGLGIQGKLWLRKHGNNVNFLAGTYEIPEGSTVETFVSEILSTPQYDTKSITILPGWHIDEIDQYLAEKNIISRKELTNSNEKLAIEMSLSYDFLQGHDSLEGFLYPDTYEIVDAADMEYVIRKMLDGFQVKIANSNGQLSYSELYEVLTLASIVEEEEKNTTNKPIVAGILQKRINESWAIGADVTVCYEDLIHGDKCQVFVNSYYALPLQTRNNRNYRYDTRTKVGLPPTPISSVSQATFEATLNYKESPYYYYLHDNSGQIHYGRNNAEHEANIQQYLR